MKILLIITLLMSFSKLAAENIKYASDFGFSIYNNGEENSDALQRALNGGGKIIVHLPGSYDLSKTVFIDSDTELVFNKGVIINKCINSTGAPPSYVFINRNAFKRIYDANITIRGLHIKMNKLDSGYDVERIYGTQGSVTFFYIRNLVIDNFTVMDGGKYSFVIQVCTFDNIRIENVHIEGDKDAIHLGRGRNFIIRNGKFRTFDDPIALNAHDYNISNPELGWIENGWIENCYDLNAPTTTGFFCRILAGSWVEWYKGMKVRNSDTIFSNGRLYRLEAWGKGDMISNIKPHHKEGSKIYNDNLNWIMIQENDVVMNCGVKNVHFKNIFLEKKRDYAFSFHFDNDEYSRSFYPGGKTPVQTGIVFENIYQNNKIKELIHCVTPIDTITFVNSVIDDGRIVMYDIKVDGCNYGKQFIKFNHVLFKNSTNGNFIETNDINIYASFTNCLKLTNDVDIKVNNIQVIKKEIENINKVSSYRVQQLNEHEICISGNIVSNDLDKLFVGINKKNLTTIDLRNAVISPDISFSTFSKGININCLFYMKNNCFWSGNNIINGNYADNILLNDNGKFRVLYPFTARKISYTRFVLNKNQTIILPFIPDEIIDDNIGEFSRCNSGIGYQIFEFKDFVVPNKLYYNLIQNENLQSNTPYLVEWYDEEIFVQATAFDVFLEETNSKINTISQKNIDFQGVYFEDYSFYNYKIDDTFVDDNSITPPFYCGLKPQNNSNIIFNIIKDKRNPDVGILNNQDSSCISYYVNQGILYIQSDREKMIHICDMSGRWIKSVRLLKGINQISDLSKGFYFIESRKIILF